MLVVELPGVGKGDLQLKIQGDYLDRGGSNKLDVPESCSTYLRERKHTDLMRTFTLPADVDAGKVTAILKNGLLTLTLPKAEAAKPLPITIN